MSYDWKEKEKDPDKGEVKKKDTPDFTKATKPQPKPSVKPKPVPVATKTCAVRLTADRQVRLHKGEPVYGVTEDEIAKLRKAHFVS